MTLRTISVIAIATGVAVFFLGLFGIPQELSMYFAIGGVAVLFAGIALLLFALRGTRPKAPHFSVFVLVALGVALHAYENFTNYSGPFSLGMFAWSLTPYALCVVVAALSPSSIPAVAGAVTALLFDFDAHNHVFVHPTSSTAGLILLFAPLWNTLVFVPLAMLAAWFLLRLRKRTNEIAP